MYRNRCGNGSVSVLLISSLCGGGQHHSHTSIVSDDSPISGIHHIGIREQGIIAVSIQSKRHINIHPAVRFHQTAQVIAQELVVRHIFCVIVGLVKGNRVGIAFFFSSSGRHIAVFSSHKSIRRNSHCQQDCPGRYTKSGNATGSSFSAVGFQIGYSSGKAADNTIDHCRKHKDDCCQRQPDGLFTAMTGVIIRNNTVADSFHPVSQQHHRPRSQVRNNKEDQKFWPISIRKLHSQDHTRNL